MSASWKADAVGEGWVEFRRDEELLRDIEEEDVLYTLPISFLPSAVYIESGVLERVPKLAPDPPSWAGKGDGVMAKA